MNTEHVDEVAFSAPIKDGRPALRSMARRVFAETFEHLYPPEAFADFLSRAYDAGGTMDADLADSGIDWRVAYHAGDPVGYAKLTALRAPAPCPMPGALELQQIYVLKAWQGRGVAPRLIQWALTSAARRDAPEMYLTVFDHNERAKRFYRRHGFEEVGHCPFTIGTRTDDDRIWRVRIPPG